MDKALPYPLVSGRFFSVLVVLAVVFTAFLLLTNKSYAADAGEFVHFRIDTELDVANSKDTSNKVTVEWSCNGTASGSIQDNTASESTNSLDGIIQVASASKEMTDATCIFGTSDTISAKVSLAGWLTRKWSASLPASGSAVFATGASMDYRIVINGVDDELGTTITLDGTSASASYSGTVASQSYSGGKKYIAGTTSGGTVTAEADGYVKATSAGTLTISDTASQSIDFGVETDSDVDESGLAFAHKIRVYESGGSFANNKFTTGAVTAGDSFGTTCTNNSDGNWYCAVPLANTETTARFVLDGYTTTNATYTDRTTESAAQTTADITPPRTPPGGGSSSTPTPTPTSSPTPTPSVTPTTSQTPTSSATPMPTVGPVKLYRKVADPKVYVQGADGFLTWVRTLEEFNAAGYKWSDVQVISGPEFAQLKIASSSVSAKLFRKANDPKVYVQGDDGTLTWVKTIEEFNAAGYNWADVQVISGDEFGKMRVGGQIKVVQGISFLRVRGGPSTSNAILDTVPPGRVLQFYGLENGWYNIKRVDGTFGWVHGGYATEI